MHCKNNFSNGELINKIDKPKNGSINWASFVR